MKIRFYRKRAGLLQSEVAQAVDVDRTTVVKWEQGFSTPRVDKLLKLAALFGCTVDELLAEAEEPTA